MVVTRKTPNLVHRTKTHLVVEDLVATEDVNMGFVGVEVVELHKSQGC